MPHTVGNERPVVPPGNTYRVWRPARSEKAPSGKLTRSFQAKSLNKYDTVQHMHRMNRIGVLRARSKHDHVERTEAFPLVGYL